MLEKNTYSQILGIIIHYTNIFALKSSVSFLTFCLLSISITQSGVHGVLIVVEIAIICFTVKFIVVSSTSILFSSKALVTQDYSEFLSLPCIASPAVSICFKYSLNKQFVFLVASEIIFISDKGRRKWKSQYPEIWGFFCYVGTEIEYSPLFVNETFESIHRKLNWFVKACAFSYL